MCFQYKRTRQLPLPTPIPPPRRILKVKHGKLFLPPPLPQYFSSPEKQHPVKSINIFLLYILYFQTAETADAGKRCVNVIAMPLCVSEQEDTTTNTRITINLSVFFKDK
jgi:hypothetical protein